jgi:hypothetical protein
MNPATIYQARNGWMSLAGWDLDQNNIINITKVAYSGEFIVNQRLSGLVVPSDGYGILGTVHIHNTKAFLFFTNPKLADNVIDDY